MHTRSYYRHRLARDLWIVAFTVLLAIFFVRYGVINAFIEGMGSLYFATSFLAGLFFTSAFTIAAATIALAELASYTSPLTISLWGALGALLGDLVIFFLVRDVFAADLMGSLSASPFKRFISHLHLGFYKWIAPLVGGLIIASPLPDEIGLAIMGIAKSSSSTIIPVSFIFNFLGILAITMIGRAVSTGI